MNNMRASSFPIVIKEELILERQVDNGKTLRTRSLYNDVRLEINKTGSRILELCNDDISVNDIVISLRKEYPDVDKQIIENDVDSFLNEMWVRHVIDFKNNNYLLDIYPYKKEFNGFIFNYIGAEDSIRLNEASKEKNKSTSISKSPYYNDKTRDQMIYEWTTKREMWFSIKTLESSIPALNVAIGTDNDFSNNNIFYINKIIKESDDAIVIKNSVIDNLCEFIVDTYINLFTKKSLENEDFCFIQFAANKDEVINESFDYVGRLVAEVNGKDVYVFRKYCSLET